MPDYSWLQDEAVAVGAFYGIELAVQSSIALSLKRIADALQPDPDETVPIAGHPRVSL